jgi:hypothetical protein
MNSDLYRKDMQKLRRKIDHGDNFMKAHVIRKVRSTKCEVPAWALNDKEIQKLLLRVFPLLKTSKAAQRAAGRWARIIHLLYHMQMSTPQVAEEMGMTLNALKMVVKGIRRVAKGRRYDNRGPWLRPRGRPRSK